MRSLPFILAAAAAFIGGRLLPDGLISLAWGLMCGAACWPLIFRHW